DTRTAAPDSYTFSLHDALPILGAGPPLLVCALALVAWRCRSWRALAVCGLAAVPWLALHHAVNYATGGTFKPANAVPEYFLWERSEEHTSELQSRGHLVSRLLL